nr:MAG TPA: hypothetical protein [Caudoviricetes sp.]
MGELNQNRKNENYGIKKIILLLILEVLIIFPMVQMENFLQKV